MSQNKNNDSLMDKVNSGLNKVGNFAKKQIGKKAGKLAKNLGKEAIKKAINVAVKAVAKVVTSLLSYVGGPILIGILIIVPILILLITLPGGKQDDVSKYKNAATELGIDFQELVAFDMARYGNKLKGKDPEDAIYYFVDIEVEKFKVVDECVKKDKDGKCIETKPKKVVTYHETASGKSDFQSMMKKLGLNNSNGLVNNINTLRDTENISVTIHQRTLEEAMASAGFTSKQKEYARIIVQTGTLDMYGDVGSTGFAAGMCFGDVSPAGKAKVSSKVESYTPLITKYAKKEGLEPYVEWLKAMMMQESGGSGTDPMQSSESGHNTKYCNSRNCIKDPEYSIQVGVETFAEVIKEANGDMMLAVQSYNFGPYFLEWVKDHGGKYTVEVARLYSTSYLYPKHGVKGTPEHATKVLKYYDDPGCTTVPSFSGDLAAGTDVGNFIATIGTKWVKHSKYVYGGGRTQSDIDRGRFDCSSFVHWAYAQAKIDLGPLTGTSTQTLNKMGKQISLFEARPGDLIFFNTVSRKTDSHVVIYMGNGNFIGAQSSTGIGIVSLSNSYWKSHFAGHVRRILP